MTINPNEASETHESEEEEELEREEESEDEVTRDEHGLPSALSGPEATADTADAAVAVSTLTDLPAEITDQILNSMEPADLARLSQTNSQFADLVGGWAMGLRFDGGTPDPDASTMETLEGWDRGEYYPERHGMDDPDGVFAALHAKFDDEGEAQAEVQQVVRICVGFEGEQDILNYLPTARTNGQLARRGEDGAPHSLIPPDDTTSAVDLLLDWRNGEILWHSRTNPWQ